MASGAVPIVDYTGLPAGHVGRGDVNPFTIAFDSRDREPLLQAWDAILRSNRWSEGPYTVLFEERWSAWNGLPSVAFASWSGAAMAALEFIGVSGETVLCPSNTYIATPRS